MRAESGLAEPAGQCSTWAVSRNGQPTRAPPRRASRRRTAKPLPRGSGVALGVICQRMSCRRISIAGVRKSSIPRHYLDYRLFRVGKPVHDPESYPRSALIRVVRPAMLVLDRPED